MDLEVFDDAEQNEIIKSKKIFLTSASIYGLMLDGLMGALLITWSLISKLRSLIAVLETKLFEGFTLLVEKIFKKIY